MEHNDILDINLVENAATQNGIRRRDLLPKWIKFFTWLFMIFGAITPVALIAGLLGANFSLAFFGFETTEPLSLVGLGLTFLFAFKGFVAYSLWMEKDWAIQIAEIDAYLSIAICVLSMIFFPFSYTENTYSFNLRIELFLIIPYLLKLRKLKSDW
jgi:hypothetical protein